MATTQYIGSRYVPILADPVEWSSTKEYEPLTIVTHEGNSYTSRQYVPRGIAITNEQFWAMTGNYDAQVEQYRREVAGFDARITENSNAISENTDAIAEAKEEIKHVYLNNEKIVIFSDSTFQSNPDVSTGIRAKSVVEWLNEICDATIDNRGVGGTSTTWLLNLLNNMSSSAISDANYVIVAYGTNDWQGSYNPFPVANVQTNAFYHAYNNCINKIKTLAPNAQILCVTPAYIHSAQSSVDNILNQNSAGSNYKAFCDVIEFIANNNNCSCIRLDELLSIDESNYNTRMIPSSNNIWVHYSEETTREIAYIIANWPHGVNCSSSSNYIDVTPVGWKSYTDTSTQSIYQMPTNSFVPNANTTLATGVLISNMPYYITYIGGGNIKVFVDGVLKNESREYTVQQFYIKGDGQSHNITFNLLNTSGSWPLIGALQLTIGRPKITDIYNDINYERRYTRVGTNSTYKLVEVSNMFMLKSTTNITNVEVANYATPIDTIPNLTGYVGELIISGQINGTPDEILGRLDGDGKIYASNRTPITLTNVRISGFGLRA